MRKALLSVLGSLVLAAGCTPTNLQETRAQPTVSPAALEFGQVDLSQRTIQSFTLVNQGDRVFDELVFELTPETDPAFTLGEVPTSIPPTGGSRTVEVHLLPLVATTYAGTVKIRGRVAAEGARDPLFEEFEVQLTAAAVNNGVPRIVVEPATVDFGLVGMGDVARQTLTIRNVGVRDLIITEALLDQAAGSPFRCPTCASLVTTLAPTASTSLDLVFSPDGLSQYQGDVLIRSNDPSNLELRVPLVGQGQQAPQACLEVLDDLSMLRPGGTVRLDGACSTTANNGAFLQTYSWELSYRTAGSLAVLQSVVPAGNGPRGAFLDIDCPDPADMQALPCSTRMDALADLAGTYEVSLTVIDSLGIRSAPATQRYRAVPLEALHIQLVWDHPTADLDLHFIRSNGPAFNHATDCYFSNRFPAWFGADATDPRNPRLDVDDQGGFGPENINVVAPEPGRYRVAVHYWNRKTDGDPSTLATLRVYVKGQLALEQGQFFSADQQMWNVVDIDWPTDPNAQPTLNPVSNVIPYPRPF